MYASAAPLPMDSFNSFCSRLLAGLRIGDRFTDDIFALWACRLLDFRPLVGLLPIAMMALGEIWCTSQTMTANSGKMIIVNLF